MKALCVIVVLSLVSMGRPAPLTCDTLVKPVEKGPDLSGRWYYIALSTDQCLATSLLNTFVWPSVTVDVTAKDTPNLNEGIFKVKMYGYCFNDSETFLYETNKFFDVNDDNTPTGDPDVLLHTSCPDCVVVKSNDIIDTLELLSRRKVVTDAELKEFEQQAECLRWSKPLVLNTDHDFDNCQYIDDDISEDDATKVAKNLFVKMYERMKTTHQNVIKCLVDTIYQYLPFEISEN